MELIVSIETPYAFHISYLIDNELFSLKYILLFFSSYHYNEFHYLLVQFTITRVAFNFFLGQ